MADDMAAYRDIFLTESAEYVQSIIDGLLALESDPGDLEPVEVVFRGAHSLKGMAGAMGYERTADLTHKMESLMDTVRQGEQAVDSDLIDLMLRAVDVVRELIDDESSGGTDVDAEALVQALTARTARAGSAAEIPAHGTDEPPATEGTPRPAIRPGQSRFRLKVTLDEKTVLKSVRAYMVLKRLNYIGTVEETVPSVREIEDEDFGNSFEVVVRTVQGLERVRESATAVTEVAEVEVSEVGADERVEAEVAAESEDPTRRTGKKPVVPKLSETQTVRVSIGHLDKLVNLVGELVIIRSQLEEHARQTEDVQTIEILSEFQRVSGELQHEVMQTRMVPVGNIFNRFPRMVRDLARDLGKETDFEMDGLDIELDRTVLDEIGDPIVHLLRNAIDHGIEAPATREKAGKAERGMVRLTAVRERDQVEIAVEDDGSGMDLESIWRKAVDRGLVEALDRESYTDEEVLLLTCAPGLSTAREATKVSGRGVGMDVVKGKIEYLGGSLGVTTAPGEGSRFTLSLPLTLAIIQALLVGVDGRVFAIPLSVVSEVVAPDEMRIDTVDGRPVAVVREGDVVPVHHLDVITGLSMELERLPSVDEHVVLIDTHDDVRALAVSELLGRQEIVIKPLSELFKQIRGIGGATLLGDGRIALILDARTMFSLEGE
jgi:two-component system chemotaxis sensor kinase CheA